MRRSSSTRNLFHPQFDFLGFFIHQEHLFSGTPESVCYSFFYCNVSSKNLLSLFLCFFKKSDALYLFSTNWLFLIVIDKFTIIEFAPFSLVTKGAFVTFGKICLCVKSQEAFSYPCWPFSFKTERTIPLIFVNVIFLFQLIFPKNLHMLKQKYDGNY